MYIRRKDKERMVVLQMRITLEERHKLKVLAAELDMTVQMFIRKLLRGSFAQIMERLDGESK